MVVKVSPNHPSKVADRIAGAIVDHAYELKKSPKVDAYVEIKDSKCKVVLKSNAQIDKSVIDAIVLRIANIEDVEYSFASIDGYTEFCCEEDVEVKARIEDDEDRRVVSVCNDVYTSTGSIVHCEFVYPHLDIFTQKGVKLDDVNFCVKHNDIKLALNDNLKPNYGISNVRIDSDMGVDGNMYLHGKDIYNPNVSLAIYAYLLVEKKGGEVCISCKKGDTIVNGVKYRTIVNKAKAYITKIGGFEKFAEWGMYRPLVRD